MHNLSTSTAVTAILLWATGVPAALAAPITTNELRWSEPSGGLHMAVSVEPHAGFIYCWLRNASTNEITYNE